MVDELLHREPECPLPEQSREVCRGISQFRYAGLSARGRSRFNGKASATRWCDALPRQIRTVGAKAEPGTAPLQQNDAPLGPEPRLSASQT
jgi:hypothetical protein